MKCPNFREEQKLNRKGYKIVVGIDEAGRGSLSGPVIACAIHFRFDCQSARAGLAQTSIRDSKLLTHKQREEIYGLLKKDPNVEWGIGRVSEKVIDRINILQATKLAMKKAVSNLEKKRPDIDYILIDGNFGINSEIEQMSVIKGDQKVFSIAAASIVAKVHRDRLMMKYHQKYPEYGFNKHKGYGTKAHRVAIKKSGLSQIHRKSFHFS